VQAPRISAMPGAFSRGSARARPDPQLFRVPHAPEKKEKSLPAEDQAFPGDESLIDDLQDWMNDILMTNEDAGQPGEHAPIGKAPPSDRSAALLLSAFDQAMDWASPIEGVQPACVLTGPGARVEAGGALAAAGLNPKAKTFLPPPSPVAADDSAEFELRIADGTVVDVFSSTAFGYTPAELVGHRLPDTIVHPDDRKELVHSLQVLLRMDEIARLMGTPAGTPPQAIRMLHRVLVGLGRTDRTPEVVCADSRVTLSEPKEAGTPPTTCTVRSRQAAPSDWFGAGGKFQMLPL